MRLLLVEDDAMIGEAVLQVLRAEHYAVDWVRDGVMADAALRSEQYDLVLLDLGLPKRDGLDVLRALRSRRASVPVLVATARDAVGDRIAGLDAGADDYVVKPYDIDELLARIRALLRRSAGRGEPVFGAQGREPEPGHPRSHGARPAGIAVSPRMGRAGAAAGPPRRGAVARPAGRKTVQLEGRCQQQRGRGVYPRRAQKARQ